MELDEAPPNEVQQLRDVRKRFHTFLSEFSVIVDPETSQATSVASSAADAGENVIFPYKCARPIHEPHMRPVEDC